MRFRHLRDLELICKVMEALGTPPTLKALQTLLAQAALDCAPFEESLEFPKIETIEERE